MVRYIKRIRAKLEKRPNDARLTKKLANRTAELHILHRLSVVRLCKLLLANEITKEELSQSGHKISAQDRLVVRLGATKPVTKFVHDFRLEHSDWRSLVHYLLYKNISGKWKSREQKKRNRKVHGSLPLPPGPEKLVPRGVVDSFGEECTASSSTYRVSNVGKPDVVDAPVTTPFTDDADLDSDAMSDIADELISRLQATNDRSTSSNPPESTDLMTDSSVGHVGGKSHSNCRPPMRNNRAGETQGNEPLQVKTSMKVKRKKTSLDTFAPVFPLATETPASDDDNPLGSDDKEMRNKSKNSSRTTPVSKRPNRFPTSQLIGKHIRTSAHEKATSNPSCKELTAPGLHPSWQAKREQKLRSQQVSITPSPTVKHIVFED